MSGSIFSIGSRGIAKSLNISFCCIFVSLRAIGSNFCVFRFHLCTFQTNKTAVDYLQPFLSTQVLQTDRRTGGQTFFPKSFLFSSWSRIYMSIPISIISQTGGDPVTKVSIPFFQIGNRYEKVYIAFFFDMRFFHMWFAWFC